MRVLVFVIVAISSAHAQSPLTLAQAQAEARQRAPQSVRAEAGLAAARLRASGAGRAVRDPSVTARYQQGDADDRAWAVGLEWTVDPFGGFRSRRDAASSAVTSAAEQRAALLLELDVEVAIALAELADAQRRVARTVKLVELRQLASRTAERAKTTGTGTQLEIDAALLDLRGAQIDGANARGDLEAARARLARLLGRRDASSLTAADEIDVAPVPALQPGDDLIERDPRVRAARADLVAARHAADAERKSARPELTLGVEVGRARHEIPMGVLPVAAAWQEWELAVSLSVPLPLIDRNRAARANANAEVLAAEARLAEIRAEIHSDLGEARARLVAAVEAATAAADIPQILDREVQLLDKALRSGGIELDAWNQQARRFVEAARTYDEVILALRRARAEWTRLVR